MCSNVISKVSIMKNSFGLLFIIFISSTALYSQNFLVANNNPGAASGINVFTGASALPNALTASINGDVIYVVPSNISYGNINISKEITIFGIGIRPLKDSGNRSYVDIVNIDASNVRISGLISDQDEIRLGWNIGTGTISGITIENCRIERILMTGTPSSTIADLLIRNNVITGSGSIATHILLNTTSNAVITNNIMPEGNIGSQPMIKATGAFFYYNIFSDTGSGTVFGPIQNNFFDHNIFYGVRVDAASGTFSGNTFINNLCFGNSTDVNNIFDTNNGNIATGNIESALGSDDPLFVNYPLTQTWNDAYDVGLQVGSSAINVNGEDIGVSGGATPFDPEGNILPLIQSVTVPAVIPVGTDLPVTIKAKGN